MTDTNIIGPRFCDFPPISSGKESLARTALLYSWRNNFVIWCNVKIIFVSLDDHKHRYIHSSFGDVHASIISSITNFSIVMLSSVCSSLLAVASYNPHLLSIQSLNTINRVWISTNLVSTFLSHLWRNGYGCHRHTTLLSYILIIDLRPLCDKTLCIEVY